MTNARWLRCGRISQRAEPDLKTGRGGLRDVQLLNALALAQLIDRHGMANPDMPAGSLDAAHLHPARCAHRTAPGVWPRTRSAAGPVRATKSAQAWASATDSTLARMLSDAGRTIAYHSETGLRTAQNALPRRGISRLGAAPEAATAGRGRGRVRRRNRACPRGPTGHRCRSGAAGGRRVRGQRPAYRRRHAEAAGRQRPRLADSLAAGGVGRPAGRAPGRPHRR